MGATRNNSGGNWSLRPQFAHPIRVKSGVVDRVWYDPSREILDVQLKSGKKYRYHSIMGNTFARLVAGKSAGSVFNEIKGWGFTKARKLPTLARK